MALYRWCQMKLKNYQNIEIENFNSSFKDGLLLCALIHSHFPDLIDYNQLTSANSTENLNLVLDVGEKFLGVPKMLNPVGL